jgi:hypothetical protein
MVQCTPLNDHFGVLHRSRQTGRPFILPFNAMPDQIFVAPAEMERTFHRVLVGRSMEDAPARTCAHVFTESSVDGILTHGVYRFPRFVASIDSGLVDVHATPVLAHAAGALEQWNGRSGPGITKASDASHSPTRTTGCAEARMAGGRRPPGWS